MTGTEFRVAFPDESDFVEFKSGLGRKPIQEAVVAFSNAVGGVIVVGVDNDGAVTGHELDESSRLRLHEICGSAHGVGSYDIRAMAVDDKPVIMLAIRSARGGVASTSDGRIVIRRGKSNPPLIDPELTQLVIARSAETFEASVALTSTTSVSPICLANLAEALGWTGDVAQLLASSPYTTDLEDELTPAGVLLLTAEPSDHLPKAVIEVYRYPDDGMLYDKRITITGTVPQQVERARDTVLAELGHDLGFVGARRVELPKLPPAVLREAVANAVGHRDYQLRSSVRIEIRPSRVTISSPGGLLAPVTLENLRSAQAARNPHLMRAMRAFGVAEDAGDGVDRMIDGMAHELLAPPEFVADDDHVSVNLPLGGTVTPTERAQILQLEEAGTLRPDDRRLLVPLLREQSLTNARARSILDLDAEAARRAIQRLRDAGLVEKHGTKSATRYLPSDRLRNRLSLAGRTESADRHVVRLAREAGDGGIQNQDVRIVTGLDRSETLNVLQDLVDRGILRREGERRGTRYYAVE